jgi:hypothetical protein
MFVEFFLRTRESQIAPLETGIRFVPGNCIQNGFNSRRAELFQGSGSSHSPFPCLHSFTKRFGGLLGGGPVHPTRSSSRPVQPVTPADGKGMEERESDFGFGVRIYFGFPALPRYAFCASSRLCLCVLYVAWRHSRRRSKALRPALAAALLRRKSTLSVYPSIRYCRTR